MALLWINCCKGRGNCPEVAIDSHIHIKDDHGGEIKLTAEEYLLVSRAVREQLNRLVENNDNNQLLEIFAKKL